MPNFISEDDIEQAILQKLKQQHGFQLLNCFTAAPDNLNDGSNRTDKREVILRDRLKAAARRLNPELPETEIDQALAILTNDRHAMSRIAANREVDGLIRDGIPIEYENAQGRTEHGRVRVIAFNAFNPSSSHGPNGNEYLAVSQLWIQGEHSYRRPDILLYINGLPLVFIELKNSNVKLQTAFDDNLETYKRDIPQLFLTNGFCILSNALETKVGSFTASWEYFFHWLRVEDEKEKIDRDQIQESGTSLERAIDGLCSPPKLLDYIENFILFHKETQKVIAQNHQFIGVNRAIAAFTEREAKAGKLGVFWHTQGKDIVYHFPRRGYLGKGMVVSLDKFTAVKMYNKIQHHWKAEIKNLMGRINKSSNDIEKARLKKILEFMRETEMAVVISLENSESEVEKFAKQGLDIKPHRDRLNAIDKEGHDIEYQFKDAEHPLRLVFVCAMWLTGFDVPSLSTLYLDKPMKDHTLMQTIARANRVCSDTINKVSKTNGEIIDYYNVFRNMKQALADYALGDEAQKDDQDTDSPIQKKSNLFTLLDGAIAQGVAFCKAHDIDLASLLVTKDTFKNLEQFKQFADALLQKDEWRKAFIVYDNTISSLYEACKPEILTEPRPMVCVFQYLRGVIDSIIDRTNIDTVSQRIAELLDESVVANDQGYKTKEYSAEYKIVQSGKVWDLSQTNFDQLKTEFKAAPYKNIEITDLRSFLENKLNQMLQQNTTRTDFAQRLQAIIDRYNAGGSSTETYYDALVDFAENLKQESERHIRLGLTEEELELFDLLKKDKMTAEETQKVKLAAKSLLNRLIATQPKVLVQDWYKDDQSQRRVKSTVEEVLDENLPTSYDRVLFKTKCDIVFDLIYDQAIKGQKWAV